MNGWFTIFEESGKDQDVDFAVENVKQARTTNRRVNAAEGVRDVFGRILAVAAKTSDSLNLRHHR